MIYRFEGHTLDSERRELRRGDGLVAVEPQVFDILRFLIDHRSRVVGKDQLLSEIWRGRVISESTLSSRIAALRRAVGDSGEQQRLIRTVARNGFRFVGAVQECPALSDTTMMDSAVVEHLYSPMAPTAKSTGPQRRQVTVMAVGIDGAMARAARLDPEDLAVVVARCNDCIRRAVERFGGFVAQLTSDNVLAYFGHPVAHEDDAERAVRAGLAVTSEIGSLQGGSIANPLRARVGIATGLVVVDETREIKDWSGHTVVGEAPQVAMRLLELCESGAVAVSSGTRHLIGRLFDLCDLGGLTLRGAIEPIGAWQVLRENPTNNRFEALRPERAPLIGRDEELELLLRRWNQAKTGEGRVVLIWGEPGIGKSHLVAALQDVVVAENALCLRYFCAPHRGQTALHPVIAQLEDSAGFAPSDNDGVKQEKLVRLLQLSTQFDAQDVEIFAELLTLKTSDRTVPPSISAQRRKELLLERFIAQLAGLTTGRPVLMVLEDAHWVDPTTRELIDLVIESVRALPVLFIMTYRPEFSPSWLGQSQVTALTLNRLGPRDNEALVKRVAAGRAIPPALLGQIVTRTDGVPLFIEELTKSVLESDLLREADAERLLAGHLPTLAVPATLTASLTARLDRLAPLRGLVQTSAVLGREFTYELIRAVTGLPDSELESQLDQIVATELVHQRGTAPHSRYMFKHALVQDAAYETLLKSQRGPIHKRIVHVFEREFMEICARQPDVLAYHCREAGLGEQAINYAINAAYKALDRSAGVEAQAHVERAMALLSTIAVESDRMQFEGRLQVALADALMMTKGFASPEALAAFSSASELLDDAAHPMESIRALCGMFNFHQMRSESPKCLDLVAPFQARQLDRPSANVLHFLTGAAHLHLGNFKQAIDHLETALTLYDEEVCRAVAFVPGYHLRSFTLIWLGMAYLYVGSLKQADQTIEAAVKDARNRCHPFTLVSALLAQARYLNHTQHLQGAIDATEEGLAIATEQRSPYHVSRANVLRAGNVVDSGHFEQGIQLMEHALVAHRKTGANFQSSYNFSCLARAYAQAGRIDRALDLADQAIAEVARTGERWWEAEANRLRGQIELMSAPSKHMEAERYFDLALDCARRQQARLWELHAAQSMANLRLAQGRHEEAYTLLSPVVAAFDDIGDTAALKIARNTLHQAAKTRPGLTRAGVSASRSLVQRLGKIQR